MVKGNFLFLQGRKRKSTDVARKPERFLEHFSGLLGKKQDPTPLVGEGLSDCIAPGVLKEFLDGPGLKKWWDGQWGEPSDREIKKAFDRMKRGKAVNGLLPPDVAKDSYVVRRVLGALVRRVFSGDEIPDEWVEAALCLLFKKGDRNAPSNYRGISLISLGEKLLQMIILQRVIEGAPSELFRTQHAYQAGKGVRAPVLILLRRIERAVRTGDPSIITSLDFSKAFDRLHWETTWAALGYVGMPDEAVLLTKRMHEGSKVKVRC